MCLSAVSLLSMGGQQSSIVSHSRLPRLELSGAVLLAELLNKILSVLNVDINSIHLWHDSTIV
jgi:hypothetical protein